MMTTGGSAPSSPTSTPEQESDEPGRRSTAVGAGRAAASVTRRPGGSEDADVRGLRALGALGNVELDALVLVKAAEAARRDRRVVGEQVGAATVGSDEPETLFAIEPFHCTG